MDHPQSKQEEKLESSKKYFAGGVSSDVIGIMKMIIVEKNQYKKHTKVFEYFLDKAKKYKIWEGIGRIRNLSCQKEQNLLWIKRLLRDDKIR